MSLWCGQGAGRCGSTPELVGKHLPGRCCLHAGHWKHAGGYEKEASRSESGPSNVTFQISRWKSAACAQRFYFEPREHLPNRSFPPLPAPSADLEAPLLFSSLILLVWVCSKPVP